MKTILAISGSDTLSGGGLQADLRTFYEYGLQAKQLLTCMVTIDQLVDGVTVYDLKKEVLIKELDFIKKQKLDGIKVGMLANLETAELISEYLSTQDRPVVLDPVLALKESQYTGNKEIVPFFKKVLLPKSTVTTPNLREAELLSGISSIKTTDEMKEAAKIIFETGVTYVVIKGGERLDKQIARDILYDGHMFVQYDNPIINNGYINGAGCTFASAICANLVNQLPIEKAVADAKTFVFNAIENGVAFTPELGNVWQQAKE